MAHYKTPARLPRQFIESFTPWELPPALRDINAQLLAHLWHITKSVGHPVLPHVYVLQGGGVKISVAANSYFIIVTTTTDDMPTAQQLLPANHHIVMLGIDAHNLVTWHHDIAPADIVAFMTRIDEELIECGILNVATGHREDGYTYIPGWRLRDACAFPKRHSYIKVRPNHDPTNVWAQCDDPSAVVIIPDYFERTVLCRLIAAREIFGPIAHELHKRRGKFDM